MAEPAKLELLTRRPGEPGFEVHEVQSHQAYLGFRPERPSATEWELRPQPRGVDGSRNYILKSHKRDNYLLLGPQEYFLWEHFDGRHSLNEISRALHFEFGSFDFEIIRQFLAKLYLAGLLNELQTTGLRRSVARRHERWWERLFAAIAKYWSRITFRVSDADHYCAALYDRGGFLLFRWPFVVSYGALLVGAIIAVSRLWPDVAEIAARMTAHPLLSTAVMLATIVFVSMLHVLVHALACKAYGRKVREMGFFLLQGLLPTFYADVTDIFMSSRRVRVMVDLSGPLVEVVCGSIALIAAYGSEPGFGQSLLFGVGLLLWESALLNLYPFNFLEMDGYNILADLLAMPTLRQQALALARRLPHRLRSGKIPDRAEWIQLGYLALCFVSVLAYLIAHLDAVGVKLPAWRSGP
jgi:putative peptide zinc metalloprotease protein